jgi:MarR family transcriptional regulator, organic hydroperoxide resistance regulator
VAGKILEELQQTKPFHHIEEEAFLNVQRTADVLMQKLLSVLKPSGLSATQYNVLRILRGAGTMGMTCKDIGNRMIAPDPDITRLLDRLEKRHLVTRNRAREDRRFVTIQITPEGLEMLRTLDGPIQDLQLHMFERLGENSVTQLVDLLEAVRNGSR